MEFCSRLRRSLLGSAPRYSTCNSTAFRNRSLGVAFRVFRTSVSPARMREWPWHWPCQKHSLGGHECVSSLVSIGPAVWPAIRNKQTDKHIRFYYIDYCRFNAMHSTCFHSTEYKITQLLGVSCVCHLWTRLWSQLSTNLHQIWNTALIVNNTKKRFLGRPQHGCGQGHVTKFVILHPLTISAPLNDKALKCYTDLNTKKYNKI